MARGGAFGDVVPRTGAQSAVPDIDDVDGAVGQAITPLCNPCRAVQTDRGFGKQIRGEILDDGPGLVVRAGNLVMQFEIAPRQRFQSDAVGFLDMTISRESGAPITARLLMTWSCWSMHWKIWTRLAIRLLAMSAHTPHCDPPYGIS